MTVVFGGLMIGLSLGLLGSGGSILTVPLLVYMLGHQGKVAIAESLAIVGGIALAGMIPYARSREVDWRSVLLFGIPGMSGTYGGAWLAKFVSGTVQLLLFGCVMLLAAWMMFHRARTNSTADAEEHDAPPHAGWKIALEGFSVGMLTGLVGVGGGFLIVPALVLLGGLPMRLAVGTSLLVIAMQSLTGFTKYLRVLSSVGASVHWPTIGIFILMGVVGTLIGNHLSSRMDQRTLRKVFAVFLVVMGVFVLSREIPHALAGPPQRPTANPGTQPSPLVLSTPQRGLTSGDGFP